MKKQASTCQTNHSQDHTKNEKWYRKLSYALIDDHPEHPRAQVQAALRQAFDIWQDHPESDIFFYEVSAREPSDIQIYWKEFEAGSGLHAEADFPPPNGHHSPEGVGIWFNLHRKWTFEERANEQEPLDFITLAAHEIGHTIGIHHLMMGDALMVPIYQGSYRRLGNYDINYYKYLYYGGEFPSP